MHSRHLEELRHSSPSSINSQEFLNSLHTLLNARSEPITEAGKRLQKAKMSVLVMTPMLLLIGIAAYFLVESVQTVDKNKYSRDIMEFSIEIGDLMHALQQERDQSVLFLSHIGPTTKTFLLQRYTDTDQVLEKLLRWPQGLKRTQYPYFRSKTAFKIHLNTHRNELAFVGFDIFQELEFYNKPLERFQLWVYDTVKVSRDSSMWKSLLAYQKVVTAKSSAGIERALGAYGLSMGRFPEKGYLWYTREVNLVKYLLKASRKYSAVVEQVSLLDPDKTNTSALLNRIETYRDIILHLNISGPSLDDAVYYFDNMTSYIDILFKVQREVAVEIIQELADNESNSTGLVSFIGTVMVLVIACIPVLFRLIFRTTETIQKFALSLADMTCDLRREQKRSDILLNQMLPLQIVHQLKKGHGVTAEYFKQVTIFFSDVVGFTATSKSLSPMEIVSYLNEIYNLFDSRVDLYDVYKVETIKDSYMVASGLPVRNGKRHASEIARLALDLLSTCTSSSLRHAPDSKVRIRIGVHSGPVITGIVGRTLPRYCLFGDTVNMASRMETTGEPDRVHISDATCRLLKKLGFLTVQRGQLDIKGKGLITTHWLLGYDSPDDNDVITRPRPPTRRQTQSLENLEHRDCLPSTSAPFI